MIVYNNDFGCGSGMGADDEDDDDHDSDHDDQYEDESLRGSAQRPRTKNLGERGSGKIHDTGSGRPSAILEYLFLAYKITVPGFGARSRPRATKATLAFRLPGMVHRSIPATFLPRSHLEVVHSAQLPRQRV